MYIKRVSHYVENRSEVWRKYDKKKKNKQIKIGFSLEILKNKTDGGNKNQPNLWY